MNGWGLGFFSLVLGREKKGKNGLSLATKDVGQEFGGEEEVVAPGLGMALAWAARVAMAMARIVR